MEAVKKLDAEQWEWTRRIVVVITPTNTLAASHCTVVTTALGGKSCAICRSYINCAIHACKWPYCTVSFRCT